MTENAVRLQTPQAAQVRVREVTDGQLPPRPDHEAIRQWLAENSADDPWGDHAPEGVNAGHYQRLVLDLVSGELRFACGDWRRAGAGEEPGGHSFPPYEWGFVPEMLVWTIRTGFRTAEGETAWPYLTAAQGNALARQAAPAAQALLDHLIEVPGRRELDWTPEAAHAGWDIARICTDDPQGTTGLRGVIVSMAAAVEADPDLVERRWADLNDDRLDDEAGYLTLSLGTQGWTAENLPRAMGVERLTGQPFVVVGTRAWMYGYRQQMAQGRRRMELSTWWAHSGRESLVTADSTDEDLVHLAEREQRAATEEDVLLVDAVEAMRDERARARARAVRELESVLGPRRVEAKKAVRTAERAVRARLDRILTWEDPAHSNLAQLGAASGWTRQAVQARAARLRDGAEPEVVITCPVCRSQDVEEYEVPVRGTDDSVDALRCLDCGTDWLHDPAADLACSRCGGSGRPGAGPTSVKVDGRAEPTPPCYCVERASL
ncbi:hypothetical protein ACFC26_41345 [Kitasatospora purpeofusca]|uniref:hypothetical protein n=1 Tax=Kitasatospora purpeofusca TaxID=67352 RepID=UPI0035E1C918